jgi:hypothetical protein
MYCVFVKILTTTTPTAIIIFMSCTFLSSFLAFFYEDLFLIIIFYLPGAPASLQALLYTTPLSVVKQKVRSLLFSPKLFLNRPCLTAIPIPNDFPTSCLPFCRPPFVVCPIDDAMWSDRCSSRTKIQY